MHRIKLIKDFAEETFKINMERYCALSAEVVSNIDGEKGFNIFKELIQVKNEKINYNE